MLPPSLHHFLPSSIPTFLLPSLLPFSLFLPTYLCKAGKPCHTVFERECVSTDFQQSIVRCRPITGRPHQIRVHLQWLGQLSSLLALSHDFYYYNSICRSSNCQWLQVWWSITREEVLHVPVSVLLWVVFTRGYTHAHSPCIPPPKLEGYKREVWCTECQQGERYVGSVSREELSVMCIWLHAIKYSNTHPLFEWTFESPRPPWAKLESCR